MTREEWLHAVTDRLRPDFEALGAPIPERLRLATGFPSSRALSAKNRTIGQCWNPLASADRSTEILVSPVIGSGVEAGAVLVHELVHAAVGTETGHKGPFKRVAKALGLEGKMTATKAGSVLVQRLTAIIAEVGEYPHAELSPNVGRKKQTTRLIKAECGSCEMVIRTAQKWIDETGLPHCQCGGEFLAA